jgi:UDP-3-O-[3-hydroxymyristoyl] N-acetylglucosamine deacetylase|uniref:UDP-3-O-acyl-N-acetylglucosamine deacetylase n=1 Tax=Desulfobacca acetoxidans TaxID=60893 RepID=A0A7C3WTV2_9BACT
MVWQKTLSRPLTFTGIGLHRGQPATLTVFPAAADTGLRFVREDQPHRPQVLAIYTNVWDTSRATTLGNGVAVVSTVEHLLAAFQGVGVDNALIQVEGPEIPIMDGSAAPFTEMLLEAGLRPLPAPRSYLVIHRTVEYREGDRWMRVTPGQTCITYTIDFPHPLIRRQRYSFALNTLAFRREIAPARTFGFLKEVAELQSQGLALGGSLDNALVLSEEAVLNPGGLRFPEEFVRHKILDALGDLALLGKPLLGRVEVCRGSHDLHLKFIRHLMAQKSAWHVWSPPIHNRTMRRRLWSLTPAWEGIPA